MHVVLSLSPSKKRNHITAHNDKFKIMENHLKEVIIRVDLPVNFKFRNKIPKDIENKFLALFPIPEQKTIQGKELQYSQPDNKLVQKDVEEKEWHFFGANRGKELVIFRKWLFITYKQYDSSKILMNDWKKVIDAIFNEYPDLQINRFGLRYINQVKLEKEQKNWGKTINGKLLHNFELGLRNVTRGFSIISQNNNGIKTNFKYGIHNPDFPSPIKDYTFTLDFDVFYEGLLSKKEILENAKKFYKEIKKLYLFSLVKTPKRK